MTQTVPAVMTDEGVTAAQLALKADTSALALKADASTVSTLSTSVSTLETQKLTRGTSQATTSGTSKDFSSIPSWVRRITVMFQGVSTNGSSSVIVQVGTAGAPTTSGYLGAAVITGSAVASANLSSGFRIFFNTSDASTAVRHGQIVLTNVTGNVWAASGAIGLSDSAWASIIGGSVSLSGVLDTLRITTAGGTDTFDAGAVNILYE